MYLKYLLRAFVALTTTAVLAQPPSLINYQGRLVNGTNLVNGTVGLTLRLFDAPSAGKFLYADSNQVVVVDGLYSTYIGDGTITNDLDSALLATNVWLEAVVNGTVLSPRERFVSVPYARMVHDISTAPRGNVAVSSVSGTNAIFSASRHSVISGGGGNSMEDTLYSVIGGGHQNRIQLFADYSTISGGRSNMIASQVNAASIGGGIRNTIGLDAQNAVIGGGSNNAVSARDSVIGGGDNNRILSGAEYALISGGRINVIHSNAVKSVISGGENNQILRGSSYGVIGGGSANVISTNAFYARVGGGVLNNVDRESPYSVVGGGVGNIIGPFSPSTIIGGGTQNQVGSGSTNSLIAGGANNQIGTNSVGAIISGGRNNTIQANASGSVISGGQENEIEAFSSHAVIVGGHGNSIGSNGFGNVIANGFQNTIKNGSEYSVIGSGYFNNIEGTYGVIPGGYFNQVQASYSMAAGTLAQVSSNHHGSFVWADASLRTPPRFSSTTSNSVSMYAAGGYYFHSGPGNLGVQLNPNATAWAVLSDRHAKENFDPIDTAEILQKVSDLPLTAWTYKHDPDHRRYIGPVAQDFHAAFGLGNDTSITTVDTDGIALAAIQALAKEKEVFGVRVSKLEEENARLHEELEAIKRILGM